jgi:DNA-binding response OmpR family regulator
MTSRHRTLVVEDDKPTADDLEELVRSLDCDPIVVDNKKDARAVLERETICFALLDLQIKLEPDSLRGNVEAGTTLVREVRRRYPDHAGGCYRMPILVVSGYAREADRAVQVMKDGADDVIQKPLDTRLVAERVHHFLQRSGRSDHTACPALAPRSPAAGLVISVLGERDRRRTKIAIGTTTIKLTDSDLRVLLHLIVAKLARTKVHKADLGATDDQGFKGISELRHAIGPALGEDVDIIDNDYHGNYSLTDDVTIGRCDIGKLIEIGDSKISELAEKLRGYQDPKV